MWRSLTYWQRSQCAARHSTSPRTRSGVTVWENPEPLNWNPLEPLGTSWNLRSVEVSCGPSQYCSSTAGPVRPCARRCSQELPHAYPPWARGAHGSSESSSHLPRLRCTDPESPPVRSRARSPNQSDAALPGVTVEARNTATNVARSVVTAPTAVSCCSSSRPGLHRDVRSRASPPTCRRTWP